MYWNLLAQHHTIIRATVLRWILCDNKKIIFEHILFEIYPACLKERLESVLAFLHQKLTIFLKVSSHTIELERAFQLVDNGPTGFHPLETINQLETSMMTGTLIALWYPPHLARHHQKFLVRDMKLFSLRLIYGVSYRPTARPTYLSSQSFICNPDGFVYVGGRGICSHGLYGAITFSVVWIWLILPL